MDDNTGNDGGGSFHTLVIVESPAKCKTITSYLGAGYKVIASMGHIRDLPLKEIGVNLNDLEKGDFECAYEITERGIDTVAKIKALCNKPTMKTILLATDPDREGEAISWHLIEAALPKKGRGLDVKRVEFHEITKTAIQKAVANPRKLDLNLVNAQQARRLVDKLVGYLISEFLWEKIDEPDKRGTDLPALSAGRVQSVAVRIVVDREREIEGFTPREFWNIRVELSKTGAGKETFTAIVVTDDRKSTMEWTTEAEAKLVVEQLTAPGTNYRIVKLLKKQTSSKPAAPFTTSTLQQTASRKLKINSKRTMEIAQQLYEGIALGDEGQTGLITYMRTDSTNVAAEAQEKAKQVIEKIYGKEYLPEKPPNYATKAKGAQEAHEAIRPSKIDKEPEKVRQYLSDEQFRLYQLIWQRFIASQMAPATAELTTVEIEATTLPASQPNKHPLKATGSVPIFIGWKVVYGATTEAEEDNEENEEGGKESKLPRLSEGEEVDCGGVKPKQNFTQPPKPYDEAALVGELERRGVGRPSTYANILDNIQVRRYILSNSNTSTEEKGAKPQKEKGGTAASVKANSKKESFQATDRGKAVTDLLVKSFPDIFRIEFTAQIEEDLDLVAEGKKNWKPVCTEFFQKLDQELKAAYATSAKIRIRGVPAGTTTGPASTYQAKPTSSSEKGNGSSNSSASKSKKPSSDKTKKGEGSKSKAVSCPKCGAPMKERQGAKGPFYGCTKYPECKGTAQV
ncbi:MAG: type I DNA topoisomerase [Chloroflexi bacterium]|nr:type I DNA topoisomerase [Chloroflexota bacterium]